jgi:hypothetical protein
MQREAAIHLAQTGVRTLPIADKIGMKNFRLKKPSFPGQKHLCMDMVRFDLAQTQKGAAR